MTLTHKILIVLMASLPISCDEMDDTDPVEEIEVRGAAGPSVTECHSRISCNFLKGWCAGKGDYLEITTVTKDGREIVFGSCTEE